MKQLLDKKKKEKMLFDKISKRAVEIAITIIIIGSVNFKLDRQLLAGEKGKKSRA